MTKIEQAIDLFAGHMLKIMESNRASGKVGWNRITLGEGVKRLFEETAEVADISIYVAMNYNHSEGWKELQNEVADVANFCMMLYILAEVRLKEIKDNVEKQK